MLRLCISASKEPLSFARRSGAATFWVQATDAPPGWRAEDCAPEKLLSQKRRWLSYRSRKTGSKLSLLFACVDVPRRVAQGRGSQFKEYGVHAGARCILKGRGLTDRDLARLKGATGRSVTLLDHPKAFLVETARPAQKQHCGLGAFSQ